MLLLMIPHPARWRTTWTAATSSASAAWSAALRDGEVVVEVRARGDIDLEQWGAERAGEAFRQVYNRPIRVVQRRGLRCGGTFVLKPRVLAARWRSK